MIPRRKLDIGWRDLFFGAVACLIRGNRQSIHRFCLEHLALQSEASVFLSIRSAFDALLSTHAYPQGGEILVSAITIPDMLVIIREHGLVPVPVDLDPHTLRPDLSSLEAGISDRTVALLVTHLFGGRVPMDPIVSLAEAHGLFTIEDCAEGYWGDGYSGHPQSDACLLSFGPIKLNTSLGGGVLILRNSHLRNRVEDRHASYPVQSAWTFFQRVMKSAFVMALSKRLPYTLLCGACRLAGKPPDAIIYWATRGFTGPEMLSRIRQQPSAALLSLMSRRHRTSPVQRIDEHRRTGEYVLARMPGVSCPGGGRRHSYWLFAIRVSNARNLCKLLHQSGFDAHTWPRSLCVVPAPPDALHMLPANALSLKNQLLFLPVYPEVRSPRLDDLARLIRLHGRPVQDLSDLTSSVRNPATVVLKTESAST